MSILDRYKIDGSKEIINVVIFGVKFLILATKLEMLGKVVIWGVSMAVLGLRWGP